MLSIWSVHFSLESHKSSSPSSMWTSAGSRNPLIIGRKGLEVGICFQCRQKPGGDTSPQSQGQDSCLEQNRLQEYNCLIAFSYSTWAGFQGLPLIIQNLNLVQIFDTLTNFIFQKSPFQAQFSPFVSILFSGHDYLCYCRLADRQKHTHRHTDTYSQPFLVTICRSGHISATQLGPKPRNSQLRSWDFSSSQNPVQGGLVLYMCSLAPPKPTHKSHEDEDVQVGS